MKLMLGISDDNAIPLAEETGGVWKRAKFLQGADPEEFELWVEEPEDA